MMAGLLVVINILAWFVFAACAEENDANLSFVNPIVIYDNIKVNWFGAILLAIVFNIALPTMAIPYWIYKICTVGRD